MHAMHATVGPRLLSPRIHTSRPPAQHTREAQVEGEGCACAKFGTHKLYRRAPLSPTGQFDQQHTRGDEKQAKNPGKAVVIGDFRLPLPRSLLCSLEQRHFCFVCSMRCVADSFFQRQSVQPLPPIRSCSRPSSCQENCSASAMFAWVQSNGFNGRQVHPRFRAKGTLALVPWWLHAT